MDDTECYLFDLNGYLLVKGCLSETDLHACLVAADQLEEHIKLHADDEPQLKGFSGLSYRFDEKCQCHSYKSMSGGGLQYVVDDFLNASPAFDVLVNHEKTMGYVREMIAGPVRIGSSELRYRYQSNRTDTHMGGKMDVRNRYQFIGRQMYHSTEQQWRPRDFDLLAARVLYALHDIPVENGPLCVVPGSHKSNFFSPFNDHEPTREPGMIPIAMEAGDAIFFTENLRHGGFPNVVGRTRKTLHLMFGPDWAGSQSPMHWNGCVHVSREAWTRYSEAQRAIVPPPKDEAELELRRLRAEVERRTAEVERLTAENTRLQQKVQQTSGQSGIMKSLRKTLGFS